jgi:hypothetical protein
MLDRLRALHNVDLLTPYAVERFVAGPDGELATVVLREAGGGPLRELAADGAFVASARFRNPSSWPGRWRSTRRDTSWKAVA